MLTVDAHEDIAWNILTFGREYGESAAHIRAREAGTPTPTCNGTTLLGLDEWLRGEVAVIFATLFSAPIRKKLGPWDTQCYRDAQEAHDRLNAQLDAYRRLADDHPRLRLIGTKTDLDNVLATWKPERDVEERVVGLVPLMEGADAIREPQEAEYWFERGVRLVGLA